MPTPAPESEDATAVRLKDGTLVLAGQARTVWVSRDAGVSLRAMAEAPTTAIAELVELPDGKVLAVGEAGVTVIEVETGGSNTPRRDELAPTAR